MRSTRRRISWLALGAVVAAATLAPAGLADKPATTGKDKPKPVASEKTWVKLGGGKTYGTYVILNNALQGLGIAAAPLNPATSPADTADPDVRFPITQGKLVLTRTGTPAAITGVRGTVGHVGGLSLTKGDVVVRVRNLVVVANVNGSTDTSKLTAQVNGTRIDLALLKLGAPAIAGKTVTVAVSEIKLTAAAATALTAAFPGTTVPEAVIGTATLKARLVGKGKA
ncbi:MAG: hypothetical protein ACRC50_12970 [Gaiella sp.]